MKYLSAKDITTSYSYSAKTARILINEIRAEIDRGRYPAGSVLDGCGVRVNEDVLVDYLIHRKALKDPIAQKFVQPYRGGEDAPGWTGTVADRRC